MNKESSSRYWGAALAAVTLAGLALRLAGIDGPSFKIWDDFFAVRLVVKDFADILRALAHQPFDAYQEFQPPLYYLIVHAFLAFGKTDAMARLTGVLAGTLTIPAVYCLGRRTLGSPAGFLAALMLAVNTYHIEYSQQIRNYVLFLCLAVWSMHFFTAWLLDRQKRALASYWFCTAAMLYVSYMSTVTVAAQIVLWLAFFLPQARRGFFTALKEQFPFLAAMGLAGAAFLPWLPIYRSIYSVLTGIAGNTRPPLWETLSVTFREYASYYCEVLGYPELTLPFLALALIGVVMALRSRARSAMIPLVWGAVTLAIVLGFNRQGLHVRTRHLIVLLPVLILFAAYPLGSLHGRFRRPWAWFAFALAIVTVLNIFNFRALPFFYRREDDRLKDLAYTLATFKRDITREFFWGSDAKWFPDVNETVMNWYLPGVFKRPGQEFSREYMRAWMLHSPGVASEVASMRNVVPRGKRGYVHYAIAGVVNTSPVVAGFAPDGSYVFRESFQSPESYGLLHGLENMHLDKGSAILIDLAKPGQATWAFAVPSGAAFTSGRVSFEAQFLADVSGVPDSVLTVSAAAPGGGFTVLGRFAFREVASGEGFDGRTLALGKELALPDSLCRDGLRVRIELDPGSDFGVVILKSVSFAFEGRPGPKDAPSPARMRLEHAMSNTLVAPASGSDRAAIPMGKPLYAFTSEKKDPLDPIRVGGADELEAFRRSHPGLEPVLSLDDGPVRYHLFDPALSEPALPVPGRYAMSPGDPARPARSLAAWGVSEGFGVAVDGKTLPLASGGGAAAYVDADGEGKGRLVLTPLFAEGGPAAPGAHEAPGVKQSGGEDCLTCENSQPCRVVYKLSAPGGFKDLAVRYFPRVQSDWKLRNFLAVAVSEDGKAFETLDALRSNASGRWDGWRIPRTARKNWSLPRKDIYLRFTLSGDGAQLWSSADFPMVIEAGFAVPGAEFKAAGTTLDASGKQGKVQVLDVSPRDFKHLLRSY